MGDGGLLSLSWNNHKATFCHILSNLRERERYTDVTLACEGKFYPVHKLVLSTCSEYFESMFEHTPCKHPIVVLKDLKCDEVESLLSYMYAGVVNVAQSDLSRLIKAAELLKVKGLAVPDEPPQESDHKRASPVRAASRGEGTFPPPKRRRRNSDGTQDDHHQQQQHHHRGSNHSPAPSPPNSPYHTADYHHDTSSRTSNSEEHRTERSIDRIDSLEGKGGDGGSGGGSDCGGGGDGSSIDQHHRLSPSVPPSPLQVVLEETLVKEEVLDPVPDNKEDLMNSGLDYGGSMSSDGRIDNPGTDPSGSSQDHQMLSLKYEQQGLGSAAQQTTHHLSDSVMEALAGPSGMQGWLSGGGGDLGAGFPGVEGFGADGRHLSSQTQGHPLELDEEGITSRLYNRGRRKYQCPFCSKASFKQTSDLKRHIRTHTGEKPFRCPFCDYRAAQSTNVKVHVSSKHNCIYRGPGTPRK